MSQTRRRFVRTLFVATQGAVLARYLPLSARAADTLDAGTGKLNFLVFGDWGRQGEPDQVEVATQMSIAADRMHARFVVSVGDNFYTDGVASTTDPGWQQSFEKVYTAPSLQVPWHVALGNHDYHGNPEAQIAYSKTSKRWTMPARYFQRTEKVDEATRADFFYLDTSPFVKEYLTNEKMRDNIKTQDTAKQLAWFKAALAASTAPWKIVIGHHPIYSGGEHSDTPELIDQVLPLLQQYKVQAYFNGHDHDLQHLQAGAVNLFNSGAGSSVRPTSVTPHTRFAKTCSGFTAVALGKDAMNVTMIDNHGVVVYRTEVARTARAQAGNVRRNSLVTG
jgi:tartrate-resistant acid phosphatase type 5